jgi:putative transposase
MATRHRKTVKHYNEPGDAHFLTFSCYRRLSLLSKDRTRLWFLKALAEAREEHEFDLWAWVLMPEHVHLLIYPKLPDYKIDKILASIKRPVGSKAIGYLEAHASPFLERVTVHQRNRTYRHFWQVGPGDDHNLYEARSIHNAIQYIHDNPVRRHLVKHAEEWIWSSARDWAGLRMGPVFVSVNRTVPPLYPVDR